MNPRPQLHRRAFTLIEIMVALAMFALLIAAVYSTWILIIKSAQVGQEGAAQVQRQRIAVRTIEDSLTCIQSFSASMKYYVFGVTNGDQASLSFVARVPDNFPRNGRFDSNLRRLNFSVESGADSEKDLVLRQNSIFMDMDPDEQAMPLVLARNVKSFVIECWDTNALNWVTEWDDTNSIPPLVRVKLAFGNAPAGQNSSDAAAFSVTREIVIASMTLPAAVQTPRGAGAASGGVNIPIPIRPGGGHP